MTRTTRVTTQILPMLAAGLFAGLGCSSGDDGNKPAYTQTGGSATTGSGGSTSNAGTSNTPSGGSDNTAGTTGDGGSSAGASSACSAPAFYPDGVCGTTSDGTTSIAKNVTCTDADTQLCDKNCGPGNSGYKTETCTAGLYVEGTCNFPTDCQFGCFQVPTADSPGCPATPPQHNSDCSIEVCNLPCNQTTPCAMCGVAAGYLDSGGSSKVGYCVCIPRGGDIGGFKWACATYPTAWPCPAGAGC